MGSDEVHEILRIISWNSMGSDEIHEVLSLKTHEIQWGLMKFMRF